MAIVKNSGRQEVIAAIQNITFGTGKEVDVQGVFAAMELPANAIVVDGYVLVSDATTAGATLSFGDVASANRYANVVALDAVAKTALSLPGFKHLATTTLNVTIAGANPAAAGVATIVVEYIVEGRAAFSQG